MRETVAKAETHNSAQDNRVRDVIAITTLPAAWLGAAPLRIGESLLAAIDTTIGPEFSYVKLKIADTEPPVELAHRYCRQVPAELLNDLAPDLQQWITKSDPGEVLEVRELGSGLSLRLCAYPLGYDGEHGVLVAGFEATESPTVFERTLLNIAANQAYVACRNARLQHETSRLHAAALREISEREQAEHALRESERFNRTLVESSRDCIETLGVNGDLRWISPAGMQMLSISDPKEVIGKSWIDFWEGEEDRNVASVAVARASQGGIAQFVGCLSVQGVPRWWHVVLSPVADKSGKPELLLAVSRDVTAQRNAEAERAALLDREREAREEAQTLNEVALTLAGELDLAKVVQAVTDAATKVSGAKFGAFFYNVVSSQGESYLLYSISGAPREAFDRFGMPRNTAVFDPTFRGEPPVRVDDILADPRYGHNAPHYGMPQGHLAVRSYLAAPVISRSGEVIGGLFFGHPEPGVFTERAERMIEAIAAQAAIAMDNARLYNAAQEEIERRARAEALLAAENNILQLIATGMPMAEVLSALVLETEALSMEGMISSILLLDESGERLVSGAAPTLPQAYNDAINGVKIGPGVGSCGTAAYRKEAVYVSDIATDPLWGNYRELAQEHGLAACCSIPILSSQGDLLGTAAMYYRQPHNPSEGERELTERAARLAGIVIERTRSEQALAASGERLQAALEGSGAGTFRWDFQRNTVYGDQNLAHLFGVGHKAIDSLEAFLSPIHPDDREAVLGQVKQCATDGSNFEREFRVVWPDQSIHWIYDRAKTFFDAQGRPSYMTGACVEITDQKEAERELEERVRQRTAELQQANEELEGFTYTIAHDLRAPLRAIVFNSKLLKEELGADLAGDHQEMLARQAENATKLAALIDGLLKFSRLGRQELHRQKLDLTEIAQEIASELLRPSDSADRFRIEENLTANGDAQLVKILLFNLMENAYKYSPEGGVIDLGVTKTGVRPMFFVRDEGVGFDPVYVKKIFQPFERLHTERDFPGTGIGLANVERIVKRHGGFITAESQPGKGATFYFSLEG
jgi:PAS domain S-box-containing protein